jgi:DNA-binding beta-propeller fold protein YncE
VPANRPTDAQSAATPAIASTATSQPPAPLTLLVTNLWARNVSFVDSERGVTAQVDVGAAPLGIALASDGRAYISTAEGIAVVDVRQRQRLALVPYRVPVGTPPTGEYRSGGMCIAVALDGKQVYVGVYVKSGPSHLEVLDTQKMTISGVAPLGVRPFDVLISGAGDQVYVLDHDSYSVSVVNADKLTTDTVAVSPLGNGAYDKSHYASLASDGHLWLPFQGRALVNLNPQSGKFTTSPLSADTHQHGITQTSDGRHLLIVGTGPAGQAAHGPSLTIVDTATLMEEIIPLSRPHEKIVVSPDRRIAVLTGGYLLEGGWDGLTLIDLQTHMQREIVVPAHPLDAVVIGR